VEEAGYTPICSKTISKINEVFYHPIFQTILMFISFTQKQL